jgi:hypothetical protein
MLNKKVVNIYFTIVCVLGLKKAYSHQYVLIAQYENGIIDYYKVLNHKFRHNDVSPYFNEYFLKNLIENNPDVIINFYFIKSTPFISDKFKNLFLNTNINIKFIAKKNLPENLLNVQKILRSHLKNVNKILHDR